MTSVAHLTAPDLMLFGIHNKFFAMDVGLPPSKKDGVKPPSKKDGAKH
jgi:hypothetical protein